MRTLSLWRINNITEVRFWQGYLNVFNGANLVVDGKYGPKTRAETAKFQTKHGLKPDESVGPLTQAKAGFKLTKNTNIVVLEIPFNKISKANVLGKSGLASNVQRFATEGGYDIVWNGPFFELATRKLVNFVAQKGQVISWGMANTGIAYANSWKNKATQRHRDLVTGQAYDMQSGAPVLIQNYKKDIDQTNIPNSLMTSKTKRNCTGLSKTSIFIMMSIGNVTLYDMQNEGINQKMLYLQGNDGGASQSLFMGGTVIGTSRAIPGAVGLRIRK